MQAIDALREIFIVALLPDRKLRFLRSSRWRACRRAARALACCCTSR